MNIKRLWLVSAVLLVAIIFTAGMVMYSNQGDKLKAAQDRAERFQREVANLKQDIEDKDKEIGEKDKEIGELKKQIISMEPRSDIDCIKAEKLDQGLWHDIHFVNDCGKDLHEVRVSISLIGEKGDRASESRYFSLWPNGKSQIVSLKIANSPVNVQKFGMTGYCKEGDITLNWTP
jgi:hypothetical protein